MRIRLKAVAEQAFPGETLAQGEILRRFSLSGVAALKSASDAEKKRAQYVHQASQCLPGLKGEKSPSCEMGLRLRRGRDIKPTSYPTVGCANRPRDEPEKR